MKIKKFCTKFCYIKLKFNLITYNFLIIYKILQIYKETINYVTLKIIILA